MSNTEYYQVKLHLGDGEIRDFSSNTTNVDLLLKARNWSGDEIIESVDITVMNPLPVERVYNLFEQLKGAVRKIPLRFLELEHIRITQRFTGTQRQIGDINLSNTERYYGAIDLEDDDPFIKLIPGLEAALDPEYENIFLDYLSMLMQMLRVCTKKLYIPRSYASQGINFYLFNGEAPGGITNWKDRMNSLMDAKIKIDQKLVEIQAVYERDYKIAIYLQTNRLKEERDFKLSALEEEANIFSKNAPTNLRNTGQASCSIL